MNFIEFTNYYAWGEAVTRGFPYGTYISLPCNDNDVAHVSHLAEKSDLDIAVGQDIGGGIKVYRYVFSNVVVDLLVKPLSIPLNIQALACLYPTETDGRIIKMPKQEGLRPGEFYTVHDQTWIYLGMGYYKLMKC